jgi:L-threonylcarbamoyladenylate synthase
VAVTGPPQVDATDPEAAVAALAAGGVVGLPTDTVYGLAARLDRPAAVAAIFGLKGRPAGLALPVLVADVDQARSLAASWSDGVDRLARRLWPGPLTLVVPAPGALGRLVGGDGTSVGVRCPDHELVRTLCAASGPLAVTSANRHGRPPATTADELVAAVGGPDRPDGPALVVDGGRCDGTPSTVADCTTWPPVELRSGGTAWAEVVRAAAG